MTTVTRHRHPSPRPGGSRPDHLVTTIPADPRPQDTSVLLLWLPLGAGGHSVRWNRRAFEAFVARHEHRAVRDIYHSALEVRVGAERFVIEMTPA